MSDVKLPEGIIAKKPHENAPDFVKAKVSIKTSEFITWLKNQSKEWVNFDLNESKKGGYYFKVDEWEPTTQNKSVPNSAPMPEPNSFGSLTVDDESDNLPF